MSTVYEIRRENLRHLIRQHGNASVSHAAGYSSASYVSQMAGRKAQRPVTEQTARRIEQSMNLPEFWLDQPRDPYGNTITHADRKSPPPVEDSIPLVMIDQEQFAVCATHVSNAMVAAGAKLSTKKFTAIVGTLLNQVDQSDAALETSAKLLVSIAM